VIVYMSLRLFRLDSGRGLNLASRIHCVSVRIWGVILQAAVSSLCSLCSSFRRDGNARGILSCAHVCVQPVHATRMPAALCGQVQQQLPDRSSFAVIAGGLYLWAVVTLAGEDGCWHNAFYATGLH
jgi:hypothetical protein